MIGAMNISGMLKVGKTYTIKRDSGKWQRMKLIAKHRHFVVFERRGHTVFRDYSIREAYQWWDLNEGGRLKY